mmetsp:Transcript_4546/g.10173  ORF Transcript_4546/g.10173 Transcript_4546/m.10173 type:complete len:1142 (-) Transcript_4546:148-3573(-)
MPTKVTGRTKTANDDVSGSNVEEEKSGELSITQSDERMTEGESEKAESDTVENTTTNSPSDETGGTTASAAASAASTTKVGIPGKSINEEEGQFETNMTQNDDMDVMDGVKSLVFEHAGEFALAAVLDANEEEGQNGMQTEYDKCAIGHESEESSKPTTVQNESNENPAKTQNMGGNNDSELNRSNAMGEKPNKRSSKAGNKSDDANMGSETPGDTEPKNGEMENHKNGNCDGTGNITEGSKPRRGEHVKGDSESNNEEIDEMDVDEYETPDTSSNNNKLIEKANDKETKSITPGKLKSDIEVGKTREEITLDLLNAVQQRFVSVNVKLPPSNSGKLGIILQDDSVKGLPVIVELNPDSPFRDAIPPDMNVMDYWVIGIGDEWMGKAKVGSTKDLQRELMTRRRENVEVLLEMLLERKSLVGREKGVKKDEAKKPPKKKKKVERKKASKSKSDAVSQQGHFVSVTIQLPKLGMGKLGLIIQDDKEHFGLPLIMSVSPESPFQNAIPPDLVQNYWVVSVKDAFLGEAKTLNSKDLQRELISRRRSDAANPVEISFAERTNDVLPPQQVAPTMTNLAPVELLPPQQQMATSVARQMMLHQAQIGQQLLLQHQLEAAATAPAESTHGRPTNERHENAVTPKEKLSRAAAKDETVRKALSEYFEEGETRSLNEFCHSYSKLYASISKEVTDSDGLKGIRDRRKGADEAYTAEDAQQAMYFINQIYSCDYTSTCANEKKRKHGEGELPTRRKTQFPPLKPKAMCKGIQSKAVEEYYANTSCDNSYLHEHCRLSNFRGWRHKDCLFITELDKYDRCLKCKSAYSNTNMTRTPKLFQLRFPVPPLENGLIPETSKIRQAIQNRMEALKGLEDVPNDPVLVIASKVMKLKGKSKIELDKGYFDLNRCLFMVCEDCGVVMLKKKRIDVSPVCNKCQRSTASRGKNKQRAEKNREARVMVGSHVPFSKLTSDEAVERYNNLTYQHKQLQKKVVNLEGKVSKTKVKAEQDSHGKKTTKPGFRAPLLPWPFYLNYNPIIAEEYTLPANLAKEKSARNSKGRPAKKLTVQESRRVGNNISGSDAKSNPPTEEVTEDAVDEPLDYASVGSSCEEEEDEDEEEEETLPSGEDGDEEGDDYDAAAASHEENDNFELV